MDEANKIIISHMGRYLYYGSETVFLSLRGRLGIKCNVYNWCVDEEWGFTFKHTVMSQNELLWNDEFKWESVLVAGLVGHCCHYYRPSMCYLTFKTGLTHYFFQNKIKWYVYTCTHIFLPWRSHLSSSNCKANVHFNKVNIPSNHFGDLKIWVI